MFEYSFKGFQQVQENAGKAALEMEKEENAQGKAQEEILEEEGNLKRFC